MSKTRLWCESLRAVCTEEELRRILTAAGQVDWCGRVRLRGLLLLLDYVIRNKASNGFSIPADLAHGFVSAIRRAKLPHTVREPLAVLCLVGILKRVRRAIDGWHLKIPASYTLGGEYLKRHLKLDVALTPFLSRKRLSALDRLEHRLNRRYPFRAMLLSDLGKLCVSPDSRRMIQDLLRERNMTLAVMRALEAVDGGAHWVRVSPRGQITTSVSGCPRMLKTHFMIGGEPAVSCDIAHAHYCLLPRLLNDRLEHLRDKGPTVSVCDYEFELQRLIGYLSDGDFYAKWRIDPTDDKERKQKKQLINVLLNSENTKCEANALYRCMRALFPLAFGICEDLKRKDHRDISKSLQYYTAKAINGALLAAQAKGIAAIPDVDAIVCSSRHKEKVCGLVGAEVYQLTQGVRCKVAGIRYDPGGSGTSIADVTILARREPQVA